jgi:hypothetical protein
LGAGGGKPSRIPDLDRPDLSRHLSSITVTLDTYGHLFPRGDDGAELAEAERALLGLSHERG